MKEMSSCELFKLSERSSSLSCLPPHPILLYNKHKGNIEEENNGYVVFKGTGSLE
jgi:hypothetical protein